MVNLKVYIEVTLYKIYRLYLGICTHTNTYSIHLHMK